jgi:UDP-N-acetylmuramate-alanine ligase
VYVAEKKDVAGILNGRLRAGDLLVTMGAGDVVKFGEEYLERG